MVGFQNQKSEDVVIPVKIMVKKDNIKLISGSEVNLVLQSKPFKIFDESIINFLSLISETILNGVKVEEEFRELVGFGFWIRKKNLLKIKTNYKNCDRRFGRGTSFHIAPGNIPVNALYTLIFGLLSGSPSIVRISKKSVLNLKVIFEKINQILERKEFYFLKEKISIIQYEYSDEISSFISSNVSVRLIWGGDETINKFKKYLTKPSCIDLTFPNRTSSAIIYPDLLPDQNKNEYKLIYKGLARDIATFSQRACSSPFRLFINSKKNKVSSKKLIIKLLKDIDLEIKNNFDNNISTLTNFKSSTDMSLSFMNKAKLFFKGSYIFVLNYEKNDFANINYIPEFGCLVSYWIDSINDLYELLPENNQTIVSVPFNDENDLINIVGTKGSDRIVSAGNALNMHLFWDGYDIISLISRNIVSF